MQNIIHEKWPLIETLATKLGVKYHARMKWRERGSIPARWYLPLILESKGKLKISDFASPRHPNIP